MPIEALNANFNPETRELELRMGFCHDSGAVIRVRPGEPIGLFEIPLYGGRERFSGNYPDIAAAIEVALAWS